MRRQLLNLPPRQSPPEAHVSSDDVEEAVLSNALGQSSFSTVALIAFLSTKEFLEQLPVYFYRLSTPLRILADALRLFAGKICLALSAALFRVVAESIEPVT